MSAINESAVFIIDLATCTGCYACAVACKDRAGLPDEVDHLAVRMEEGGVYPQPQLTFRPSHCFHCQEAPCAPACPVGAIVRRADGLWQIDAETCIGCGDCAAACPFDAIEQQADGTATTCDGCVDELALGREPTCVRACPMRALDYGPFCPAQHPGRTVDGIWDDHGVGPRVVYLCR